MPRTLTRLQPPGPAGKRAITSGEAREIRRLLREVGELNVKRDAVLRAMRHRMLMMHEDGVRVRDLAGVRERDLSLVNGELKRAREER